MFEVMGALAIFTMMIIPITYTYQRQNQARQISKAINEVLFLGEAAQNFYVDNGRWPDETNACAGLVAELQASLYLGGGGNATPFGGTYTTTCTATILNISIDGAKDQTAAQIVSGLPRSQRLGTVATSSFGLPGSVPGLQAYLRRTIDPAFAAANTMETSIDMTGNDLRNVDQITGNGTNPVNFSSAGGVNVSSGPILIGNSVITPAQSGSIELGGNGAGLGANATPYIDFHSQGGGSNNDFNARIIADNPGGLSNGLSLIASGRININTPTLTTNDITSSGTVRARDVLLTDAGGATVFRLSRVIQFAGLVENGDTITKPTCAAGDTPGVVFGAERMAEGPTPASYYGFESYATDDSGSPTTRWLANIRVFTGLGPRVPAAGYGRVSVFTFCY